MESVMGAENKCIEKDTPGANIGEKKYSGATYAYTFNTNTNTKK